MPVINGVKMACEPCIRGHRAPSCSHGDGRVMVPVRKPGRPLRDCPHAKGSQCSCDAITVAIPRKRKCACSHDVESSEDADMKRHQHFSLSPSATERPESSFPPTPSASSTGVEDVVEMRTESKGSFHGTLSPANYDSSPPNGSIPAGTASFNVPHGPTAPSGPVPLQGSSCCAGKARIARSSAQMPGMIAPSSTQITGSIAPSSTQMSGCCQPTAPATPSPPTNYTMPQVMPQMIPQMPPLNVRAGSSCGVAVGAMQLPPNAIPAMPVQPLAFSLPLCTGCLTNTQATFLIYPSLQGNVVERADPATLPQRLEGANVVYVAIPCGPNAPPGPYAHAHPQPTTPWLPNSHIPHQSHPLQRQNETYSNAHAAHECLCGPGCECLGCIDHPFNSATEAYVQSAYHLSNSEWNGGAGLTGESNGAGLQSAGHATPQEETSDDISLQLALAGLTNNSPPGQVVDPNSFFFVEYPIDLAYTDNNAGPSGRAAAADLANGRRNDCDML